MCIEGGSRVTTRKHMMRCRLTSKVFKVTGCLIRGNVEMDEYFGGKAGHAVHFTSVLR